MTFKKYAVLCIIPNIRHILAAQNRVRATRIGLHCVFNVLPVSFIVFVVRSDCRPILVRVCEFGCSGYRFDLKNLSLCDGFPIFVICALRGGNARIMATVANDPLKERLLSKGLWADFVRLRHDACERDGLSSAKAAKQVLESIDPEAVALLNGRGRPMKKGVKAVAKAAESAGEQKKSLADVRLENRDAKSSVATPKSCRVGFPSFAVTKDTFAGKGCPYTVSLNWAYSNHRIVDISPNDAPSAVAWNLLLDMRESPSIKADVLKGWSNAMARKAEVEEQSGDSFDGKETYDLAGVIAGGGDDA